MNKEEINNILNECKDCNLKECIRLWDNIYRKTANKRTHRATRKQSKRAKQTEIIA